MLRKLRHSSSRSNLTFVHQCGSNFNNGGDGSLIDNSRCSMPCAGDNSIKCGGGSTLSLYKNPSFAPAQEVLPAGWSSLGCLVDNFNSTRTMASYRFTSKTMTNALCISKCQSLNYKYAGSEYSVRTSRLSAFKCLTPFRQAECYCSNTLTYNAVSKQCSMPCSGAPGVNCGGPNALTAVRLLT